MLLHLQNLVLLLYFITSPVFATSPTCGSDVSTKCTRDNCLRAAIACSQSPFPTKAKQDCSSFFLKTAIPPTVTQTSTICTTITRTHTVFTTVVVPAPLGPRATPASTAPAAPSFTVRSPSVVPAYASACSGTARYSSACSCLNVPQRTTTLATPTTIVKVTSTKTITHSQVVTCTRTPTSVRPPTTTTTKTTSSTTTSQSPTTTSPSLTTTSPSPTTTSPPPTTTSSTTSPAISPSCSPVRNSGFESGRAPWTLTPGTINSFQTNDISPQGYVTPYGESFVVLSSDESGGPLGTLQQELAGLQGSYTGTYAWRVGKLTNNGGDNPTCIVVVAYNGDTISTGVFGQGVTDWTTSDVAFPAIAPDGILGVRNVCYPGQTGSCSCQLLVDDVVLRSTNPDCTPPA